MPSLFAELRRRRVLRVAGAYVVVAWILMQAGEIIFPAFELPNRALRALILGLGAGLPVVIVLAWLLDVTPSGIRLNRRASNEDETHSPDMATSRDGGLARSLEMLLLGVFVPVFAFLMLLGVLRFAESGASPTSLAGGPSLAVLPFENLSLGAEDRGFFARGIHEDVLTHLTRVSGLKLISRTSVLPYADRKQNIRAIGRELGVGHILEGSVRRTPKRVRVSAQLIRVETDEHLWAQNFDADLEDILDVQSRIAQEIAAALEAELITDTASNANVIGRVVPGAYDAYLRARDLHRDLDTSDPAAFARARHLYELALENDPTLAMAWLQLGLLHSEAFWFESDRDAERPILARKALDRAADLGIPTDRIALAEGIYAYYVERDFGSALNRFGAAAREAPGSAEAHFYRAMILRRLGELEPALAAQRKAIRLDPLNDAYQEELVLTLAFAGRLEDALEKSRALLARQPTRARTLLQTWQLELELNGRPAALLEEILATPREHWIEQHYSTLERVAILADRPEVALDILVADPAPSPDSGYRDYQIALLEGLMGRVEAQSARAQLAEEKFGRFVEDWPDSVSEMLRMRIEALFAARVGDWDRALDLQSQNVEAMPIDDDLIVGTPPLWRLLRFELEAGRVEEALATLDRLRSKVALGSILFGGHYVLEFAPEFETARRDPRVRERLEAIRPDYAANWPPR